MTETTQISLTTNEPFLDITNPLADIEISIREDRQVLWVNVGGICRLRINRIGNQRIHITGPAPDQSAPAPKRKHAMMKLG